MANGSYLRKLTSLKGEESMPINLKFPVQSNVEQDRTTEKERANIGFKPLEDADR